MTCAGPGGGRGASGGGEHGVSAAGLGGLGQDPTAPGDPDSCRGNPLGLPGISGGAGSVPAASGAVRAASPAGAAGGGRGRGRAEPLSCVSPGTSLPAEEEAAALKAVGTGMVVGMGYLDVLEPCFFWWGLFDKEEDLI